MVLVDFQVEGFSWCLHHGHLGYYDILNGIHFDGGEWNIYCDCVDELPGRGGSEVSNNVGYITVTDTIEL